MIRYTVIPSAPHAHRLTIQCDIEQPNPSGQSLRFPTWIPGSYLIREFARHVVSAKASQDGQAVELSKTDKQTWQTAALKSQSLLTVVFEIHAWDLSVRGAHFDQQHLFFNGCAVFPEVISQSKQPCEVLVNQPADTTTPWQIFTGLQASDDHTYLAKDYAELIDHPFEMGQADQYTVLRFTVDHQKTDIEHTVVLRNAGEFNAARLKTDLQKICGHIIALFGTAPPFSQYLFLTTLTGNSYGGLEHRNSTALLASRDDLPAISLRDDEPANEDYTRFLGLCAHEHFHAWNVKALQDASLVQSDLRQEAYTPLLWFFEGFTSYYDDLSLVRSGVISSAAYCQLLDKTFKQVNSPAEYQQSVAESSFDTWIKYYRQDENAPNSVVSYYAKGSLIALALDLTLRRQRQSLDAWMRALWHDFALTGTPLTEAALFQHLSLFANNDIATALREWVHARKPLDLAPLLNDVGLLLQTTPRTGLAAWGLRVSAENAMARVTHVLNSSPAEAAGLAPNDLLVALNGQRLSHANLEKSLARLAPSTISTLCIFRDDQLCELLLQPACSLATEPQLGQVNAIDLDQTKQQLAWLSI